MHKIKDLLAKNLILGRNYFEVMSEYEYENRIIWADEINFQEDDEGVIDESYDYEYYPILDKTGRIREVINVTAAREREAKGLIKITLYEDIAEYFYAEDAKSVETATLIIEGYDNGYPKIARHFMDGVLHRMDGPAITEFNPDASFKRRIWCLGGLIDYYYGPAVVIYENRYPVIERFYSGPVPLEDIDKFLVESKLYKNGEPEQNRWVNEAGLLHKVDGPALIKYSPSGKITEARWFYKGKEFNPSIAPKIIN